MYLSKLSTKAHEAPLPNAPENPIKPWFTAAPLGENKLGTMVKNMFAEVGISGKTNHRLRATGATDLYTANVPENMIQQRTGHRSLRFLCTYKRTTEEQELVASKILTSDKKIDYALSVCKTESGNFSNTTCT